ncbi:MAG TPA: gliding motility-associated C-terminal domain-containing protein [Puia sp.]|nr:gliding motility-associated C-terminal domain-containing protein [Puia sp.]
MKTVLLALLMLISTICWSQTFPAPGQLASTAFPVCGTSIFHQAVVPIGSTTNLVVPGCDSYADTNPFWYSFTCFVGGTLGFLITPNNLKDDYDFMLFDITGHNPNDVYTNVSLIVTGNWSGSSGLTGAKRGGSIKIECASNPAVYESTFSSMPTLIQGHKYLLLVSHYTQTQSGYSLAFGSGTAVITDTVKPNLKSASVSCDRKTLTVALNKKMRCNSLASNGSDFLIASNPVSITGATGMNCNNGFDMDTIQLTVNNPLPPGNYSLQAQIGTDNNTLLDDCGTQIDPGDSVNFKVLPLQPTPFDSLTRPTCAPDVLQLIFSKPIECSSIAPDGSDFTISGNPSVSISAASGVCSNGLTSVINLTLNAPIVTGGNFNVTLVSGSDGNTIIDMCGMETSPGAVLSFSTKDTVSASFNYNIGFGCKYDTIVLNYRPDHGENQWQWIIDSSVQSSLMDPSIVYSIYGLKNVKHIVSNGFCSDTVSQVVNLNNALEAAFQAPNEVCPKDVVNFTDVSIGNVISWYWDFGDGTNSNLQTPLAHLYPNTWTGKTYTVSLVVQNNLGCYDTLSRQIMKLQSCYITVPNAFTPNGDGKNDYLYPLNAFSATNLEFRVFNRYGQLVFETQDWTRKWDGTIDGKLQPSGTYVWTLRYTDAASGKNFFQKGTSVLIR